jgi:hypothetical protein
MCELDRDGHRRPATDALEGATDRLFRLVRPEPDVGVGNAPFGQHGGRFDREQRRTGQREMTEVDEVPVRHAAVDGGVLAHRRNDDAVRERDVGDRDGGEQLRCGHA